VNAIENMVQLSDGRSGLRTSLEVKASEVAESGAVPVLDFVASSATLDRYHEIIEPAGWRLDAYRKNPVFQNAHNYGDVIFTLGKALVTEVRDGQLFQRIEFATEVNPMARIAYGLYKGGFLRAVSVGFVPLRWENGGAEAEYRRKYLEQELLELSAVAIPANPDALVLGVKSGAVAKEDLAETVELLRGALGERDENGTRWKPEPGWPSSLPVIDFARKLQRVMRA
jgi:HK97 family phage prohead protease